MLPKMFALPWVASCLRLLCLMWLGGSRSLGFENMHLVELRPSLVLSVVLDRARYALQYAILSLYCVGGSGMCGETMARLHVSRASQCMQGKPVHLSVSPLYKADSADSAALSVEIKPVQKHQSQIVI